jgi:hypothetical protein
LSLMCSETPPRSMKSEGPLPSSYWIAGRFISFEYSCSFEIRKGGYRVCAPKGNEKRHLESWICGYHRWNEGESVNKSQMDIKLKTCDTGTWVKVSISWHILHQLWHTSPIALLALRNPQHRSLLTVVSTTSAPGRAKSATLERPWGYFLTQLWNTLRVKHLPS